MRRRLHPYVVPLVAAMGCGDDGAVGEGAEGRDASSSGSADGASSPSTSRGQDTTRGSTTPTSTGATGASTDATGATTDATGASTDATGATTDATGASTDATGASTDATETTDGATTGGGEPVCGDDLAEGDEACDGVDLAGLSCASLGFQGGPLSCDATCQPDTTACWDCGDGEPTGNEECDDGNLIPGDGCSVVCTDEAIPRNFAFVTAQTHPADLGGLAGADALCNAAATDAGLPGTYVALLSTTDVAARDRVLGTAGWTTTGRLPFANTPTDLFDDHQIFYPIVHDEHGDPVDVPLFTHTGTFEDGTPYLDWTCNDWQGGGGGVHVGGFVDAGWPSWISGGVGACTPARLYCLALGPELDVTPEPAGSDARIAFVSTSEALPGEGLGGMDALCQADAEAHGLADDGQIFLALLADTDPPIDRFDLAGSPWMRIDGVRVSWSAADFAAGTWNAPIYQLADGGYTPSSNRAWAGAATVDGAPSFNCAGWTSSGGDGVTGRIDRPELSNGLSDPCAVPRHLWCGNP